MKIVKNASNKSVLKISRDEWTKIGQSQGWMPKAAISGLHADLGKFRDYKTFAEAVARQFSPEGLPAANIMQLRTLHDKAVATGMNLRDLMAKAGEIVNHNQQSRQVEIGQMDRAQLPPEPKF